MLSDINEALLKLPKRAESSGRDSLISTFVDVGPLFTLLSSTDHQILFGRRGTGKTHALNYLASIREKSGDIAAVIDLRSVGSSTGIYSDETLPLPERATRLLVDTLNAIHETLVEFFVDHRPDNLATAGPALDSLAEAISDVRVTGSVEIESQTLESQGSSKGTSAALGASRSGLTLDLEGSHASSSNSTEAQRTRRSGQETHYVNFGQTGSAFTHITASLGSSRLWVLLDEWSSIPLALQPFLADLIRRSLLPIPNVTVKICAIEHRSSFKQNSSSGPYLGIEVGADAAADVNLDDFMVFDNDEARAKDFFSTLIARHIINVSKGAGRWATPFGQDDIIKSAFTDKRALEEFVRACEGVPRDAINILALAAQRALAERISVQHIRTAARNWYQRDKETAAVADPRAQDLLHWIVDEVIGKRRARAFLLETHSRDSLVQSLYDARVLHLLKRGTSTHDQPGVRYDVYKLDYGCFVDLMSTARAPLGLFALDDPDGPAKYIDVPPDDYRSIRRAILDLAMFYRAHPN